MIKKWKKKKPQIQCLPEICLRFVGFFSRAHVANFFLCFFVGIYVYMFSSSDGSSENTSPVRGSKHLNMTEVQVRYTS